jgi:hypothetical protein
MKSKSILFAVLLGTSSSGFADRTVEEWQAKAIETYPDLAVSDSAFNKRFVELYQQLKLTKPQLFETPQWPFVIAQEVAKSVKERTPSPSKPEPRIAEKIELITADAVKQYWLKNIVEPRSLDANFHQLRTANAIERQAINDGSYNGLAQDEANRLNIDILRANGYAEQANALQQARNDYAARVAVAQQNAEQKRQLDDMTSSLRNQMQRQQEELQRQTSELQNISRQLRR